ncbi:MAG: amino acid ABC transporter permease [Chloroflexi bacterium]|nr:MAG: amino acid ABC transporter permease [Chloroflexota bacterium]RLC86551.1 MAG: amino acid ABC transporter permease [Chloroflexota bacterium]HEY72583.1 amino acid ABC transporter permease [Thermoflexia bacterium]
MSTNSTTVIRPPSPPGPVRWLKKNLFSTWYDTVLTILAIVFLYFVLKGVLSWVLFTANWAPVINSPKLFAVGQYPPEQLWRVGTILFMVSFLFGLSWRVWGGTVRTFALALVVAFSIMALLPISMDLKLRIGFLANPILTFIGYQAGRTPIGKSRWVAMGWLLSFVLTILLLSGIEGINWLPKVETGLWGGLLLTFLLALVGIVASFPIGVLLALGRQSKLPVLKGFCVLFIEIVRGVPLVTILFMASIILPLFLPEGIRIDRVLRAMVGMTLFAAAYMAENIRGGLQAIPVGQIEAAKAVGLNNFQAMGLIVLPQALRLVIPTIVGQFIALFMDTTLAAIVGLLELLAIGRAVLESNVEWKLLNMEVYLFIAVIFWVFNYAMSYASRRLEVALGVGER